MILRNGANWPFLGLILLLLPSFVLAQAADAEITEIEKASNASLLWGPYRPNLYFGVRPRLPNSLMTGLLWAKVEDYASVQHSKDPQSLAELRHDKAQC